MAIVPFTSHPAPRPDPVLDRVAAVLDPVLAPLGFARGQAGVAGGRAQVIFCRGERHSPDGGCVDLVVDLDAAPTWHITDVRYWGYPSERWHMAIDAERALESQLEGLACTLPHELA
jgi:hypothetical protein